MLVEKHQSPVHLGWVQSCESRAFATRRNLHFSHRSQTQVVGSTCVIIVIVIIILTLIMLMILQAMMMITITIMTPIIILVIMIYCHYPQLILKLSSPSFFHHHKNRMIFRSANKFKDNKTTHQSQPQDVQPLHFLGTSFPLPQSPKRNEARLCETERNRQIV